MLSSDCCAVMTWRHVAAPPLVARGRDVEDAAQSYANLCIGNCHRALCGGARNEKIVAIYACRCSRIFHQRERSSLSSRVPSRSSLTAMPARPALA